MAIVRNVDKSVLTMLAERCVTLAAKTSLHSNDERMISVSISVGAALYRVGDTAESILQRADELMYRCKAAGKGCALAE